MRDAFFVASRGQFISRVHVQLNIKGQMQRNLAKFYFRPILS